MRVSSALEEEMIEKQNQVSERVKISDDYEWTVEKDLTHIAALDVQYKQVKLQS